MGAVFAAGEGCVVDLSALCVFWCVCRDCRHYSPRADGKWAFFAVSREGGVD